MGLFDLPGVRRLFRMGHLGPGLEREVDDELDFHFRATVEGLEASGLSPDEAHREAERRFGDRRAYRRRLLSIGRRTRRTTRRRERMDAVRQALGFAGRGLRRSPAFALAVIVTLALGIGANATMFGVADRLLLSPPEHVADADRVARLLVSRVSPFTARSEVTGALTWPDVQDFRDVGGFEAVAGYASRPMTLGSGPDAERVQVQWAGGEMFDVLGVRPRLGRFFGPDEDVMEAGGGPAVLGHGFWQRRFGGSPDVLGTQLHVGRERYTVVGVAPRGFTGPTVERVDLWIPLLPAAVAEQGRGWEESRRWYWLGAVARLVEGGAPEAAEAEATAAHRNGRSEEVALGRYDEAAAVVLGSLVPGRSPDPDAEVAVSRWLLGVSMLVLLIACANVANLHLARSLRRGREMAVRVALGMGRTRLLGHLLLESLLLTALAGGAALLAARWGGAALHRTLLPDIAPGTAFTGSRLVLFTGAAVLLATVLAGLLPAVRASRPDLTRDLGEGARGSAGAGRLRRSLLLLQVGLSTVLLVGAGLFVRSLQQVYDLDLGFEPEKVVHATVETAEGTYNDASSRVVTRAAERLRGAPGVRAVAVASLAPFQGLWGLSLMRSTGDTVAFERGPYYYAVTAGYFDAMGMRLVQGRAFTEADEAPGAEPVTVMTRDLASRLFGGADPLGRCVLVEGSGEEPPCTRVVGVLADHRFSGLDDPESPVFYLTPSHPASARTPPQTLVASATDDADELVPLVRRALMESGSGVRYARVAPLSHALDERARSWRLGATLFLVFGGLALTVALVGLYALISFDVAERRMELGIRAAMGASGRRLARDIVSRALLLTGLGVGLGLAVVLAGGRFLGELLFRVRPWDPPTVAVVVGVLLAGAALATALPARRATRIDPAEAMRAE